MMRTQPRGGHIFNIDGAGSDGRPTPRSDIIRPFLQFLLLSFSRSPYLI